MPRALLKRRPSRSPSRSRDATLVKKTTVRPHCSADHRRASPCLSPAHRTSARRATRPSISSTSSPPTASPTTRHASSAATARGPSRYALRPRPQLMLFTLNSTAICFAFVSYYYIYVYTFVQNGNIGNMACVSFSAWPLDVQLFFHGRCPLLQDALRAALQGDGELLKEFYAR